MIQWTLRVLKVISISIVVLVVLAFVLIQIQQRILRHRAEQLLADMHELRLYQSTWQDAQRLMQKWGAWGHYDGQCNTQDCSYAIQLTNPASDLQFEILRQFEPFHVLNLYSWLGGKYFELQFKFIVEEGKIRRTLLRVNLEVPPKTLASDDYGYSLIVTSESRSTLGKLPTGTWVLGGDEQLAEHPNYKAGRPGGCTGCLSIDVTYSTHTPQMDVVRLTSFNLDCLTRWHSCERPEDLFPAAEPWHFWDSPERYEATKQRSHEPPNSCDIPIWALGRDAANAVVVDVVSSKQVAVPKDESDGLNKSFEQDQVKIISILKGTIPWPVGTVVTVNPYRGQNDEVFPLHLSDHLLPEHRYVLLSAVTLDDKTPTLMTDRCGIQEFTPAVNRQLKHGFTQDDLLRVPEL
jgi:hypothetical protein